MAGKASNAPSSAPKDDNGSKEKAKWSTLGEGGVLMTKNKNRIILAFEIDGDHGFSGSGKTIIVAKTGRPQGTGVVAKDTETEIMVNLTAYKYPEKK